MYIGIIFSCSTEKDTNVVRNSKSAIIDESICVLQENLDLVGEINSLTFLDEEKFLITSTSPERVILYDTKGEQIRSIGKKGEGPFEYICNHKLV